MVTSDQTHINPADYFHPDAKVPEQPLFSKYFYPAVFPTAGVLSVALSRYMVRRPPFSGIQLHILAACVGLIGGFAMETNLKKRCGMRDAMIYHYITTHPEDFPPIERVKYKDLLQKWAPNRC